MAHVGILLKFELPAVGIASAFSGRGKRYAVILNLNKLNLSFVSDIKIDDSSFCGIQVQELEFGNEPVPFQRRYRFLEVRLELIEILSFL
ncbi:hypothetical protein CEXT_405071 [Caerostris extrusa]|uniref:Uncharacterized protein n=1 Tax=Caerostris extrusa TaxID=172846 RepID=A0AAV4V4J7_CAEEX|nr:hypothetical protein CEXT_405071 [Caerostris extrusa]